MAADLNLTATVVDSDTVDMNTIIPPTPIAAPQVDTVTAGTKAGAESLELAQDMQKLLSAEGWKAAARLTLAEAISTFETVAAGGFSATEVADAQRAMNEAADRLS